MTDVTNPRQVTVEDEVYANPDPNGGTAQATPRQVDKLVPVANQSRGPAANDVEASVFPTPVEASADAPVFTPPVPSSVVPPAPNVVVADQNLVGASVADFIVVGPAESFQTNATTEDLVTLTVTGVYDADALPSAPSATTTRYYLLVATPPLLTSYPVSLLGRQVIFTSGVDEDAARFITGYGSAFLVVNRDDLTQDNGGVPTLDAPSPGDTLSIDVARLGSEQVNTSGSTVDVVVAPPPQPFLGSPQQGILGGGTTSVSTGLPPGTTIVSSGVQVPTARNVDVSDECQVVGLPTNVYV